MNKIICGFLLLVTFGCKQRENVYIYVTPTPGNIGVLDGSSAHARVAIIDSGFDMGHQVFNGKVIGSYSIECKDAATPANGTTQPTAFDQIKAGLLQELKTQDDSCSLRPGVELYKSQGFRDFAKYRQTWNQGIQNKTYKTVIQQIPDAKTFLKVLGGDDGNYIYHGTATSGIIAYQNPSVDLILIQKQLGKPGETQTVQCPKQADIDLFVKLFTDADVLNAVSSAPMALEEEQMLKLFTDKHIQLVNMSFGQSPRAVLEKELAAQCGALDFKAYFKAQAEVEKRKALGGKRFQSNHDGIVFVEAAGNDGVTLNSGEDTPECPFSGEKNRVAIGAYDANQKITDFSNRGPCVDAYALGDDVIVATPDNFLFAESGTSFSAPIVVRYLSKQIAQGASPEKALDDMLKSRKADGFLPAETYPQEIALQKTDKLSNYALSDSTAPQTTERVDLAGALRPLWRIRTLRQKQ